MADFSKLNFPKSDAQEEIPHGNDLEAAEPGALAAKSEDSSDNLNSVKETREEVQSRANPFGKLKNTSRSLSTEVDESNFAAETEDFEAKEELKEELEISEEFDSLFPENEEPLEVEEEKEVWAGEPLASKTEFIRSTTGEILDRDDLNEEDFATFEGVDPINPLLEDDDEEYSLTSSTSSSIPTGTTSSSKDLSEIEQKIRANAQPRRFFPEGLDEKFDKRLKEAPATKEVVAASREGKIRQKEAEKLSQQEFKSEFIRKPVETVAVNEIGETKTESKQERKRLTKTGPTGKLKGKEVEFFKNMGSRTATYTEGLKTTELLAGPLNQFATPEQKRERLQKLSQVFDSRVAYRQGANFILNEKMTEMLSFLALFRYATHSHISRIFGESPRTTLDRLYRMQANGLVESRKIYAQHAIWFLTEPGIIVSGYDVRRITDSRLTYSMFPHQFTVNHVAANLWGGKLNVLGLSDFPSKNRVNLKGEPIVGEQLTSELEVLSSFAKMKLFEDSAAFRPKLMGIMDSEFKKWADSDRSEVPSPEMIYGNEWMFTLFPPLSVGIAYHVPDLVVKRSRASDGSPRSIAVEIEINNKPIGSYYKSLQSYADDKRVFDKVVWVCKTIGPAKKLEKIGRELGIYQSGKLKIVPIWTNDGVFKGRDLWTI